MIQQQVLFLFYLSVVRKYTFTYRYNILQVAGKSLYRVLCLCMVHVCSLLYPLFDVNMVKEMSFFLEGLFKIEDYRVPPFSKSIKSNVFMN